MGLRIFMQDNPAVAAFACILVIALSAFWMTRGEKTVVRPAQIYFYDLASGELFSADRMSQPPIDAPGGAGRGVKAEVYGCGECSGDNRIIAYMTTYSEAAQKAMQQLTSPDASNVHLAQAVDQGTLVAVVPEASSEPRWVPAFSDQGAAIMKSVGQQCPEAAITCYPEIP